jgi:hypothetical protein
MQIETRSFRLKGKEYTGSIAWPDSLQEALAALGEWEVFRAFRIGYLEICRKQICGVIPRRRSQKIDLSGLSEQDQELVLQAVAELRESYQLHQQAQKSVPPEEPHTFQNDFDETPEEVPASTSPHDDSFEADFARYSSALDS